MADRGRRHGNQKQGATLDEEKRRKKEKKVQISNRRKRDKISRRLRTNDIPLRKVCIMVTQT